jgi:predicted neutral ceramidase superfamily lipid hydrolase
MKNITISLFIGRYLVTHIAIRASSAPPIYRLTLFHGMTTNFKNLKGADELESIPEKVAIFERLDYSLHYYLTDVQ